MPAQHPISPWRLLVAAIVLAAPARVADGVRAADAPVQAVHLVIDYGDGVQKVFTAIQWAKGMTVLDAMKKAQAHPRGITFKHTGAGAAAFVTRIDELKNEGAGNGQRNWLYWVNAKLADRGVGAFELQPSDVVLWRFDVAKP